MHTEPIIEIRKLKEINIEGGVVFDGFHGIGLSANHIRTIYNYGNDKTKVISHFSTFTYFYNK